MSGFTGLIGLSESTFFNWVHGVHQNYLHITEESVLVYICQDFHKNILLVTKPFLQFWPCVMKTTNSVKKMITNPNFSFCASQKCLRKSEHHNIFLHHYVKLLGGKHLIQRKK